MNNKVAVAMIVRGVDEEAELLTQCLTNISEHVDGIFLDINHKKDEPVSKKIIAIAKKFKTNYIVCEWKNNFAEARNNNFSRVPKDEFGWIMWIDSDDTVNHPEQIKLAINTVTPSQQAIWILYDYDHDDVGNTTVSHWVARVVRNNGSYRWKSSVNDDVVSVHETLCEVVSRPKALCEDFVIVHHANADRRVESLVRNIKLLEGMFKRQQKAGKFDPRTLFYLATHYYDARNLEDAMVLLENYLQVSGWAEERCEALVYMGNMFQMFGKDDDAHRAYLSAIGEYQNNPRPFIELARLDFKKGRFEESSYWIEKCLQLPKPVSTIVRRPMENTFDTYLIGAQACINLGGKKLDLAKKYVKDALKLRPLDEHAIKSNKIIDELITKREDIRAAARLIRKFKNDKEEDKIIQFIDALPYDTQDNPLILTTRHQYTDSIIWGPKTIAIYVGQGPLGIWGPWSLESGIGGSEEAVIKMSRELSDLGWFVTVFGTPGNREGKDGDYHVIWKQYYEFNPKDEYNILVSWRNPTFFDVPIECKKSYLWLHDVMDKVEFQPERLDRITKVIFVGKYHSNLYEDCIPEEKRFASSNGISVAEFIDADNKFERIPHSMIYMSAYNRGLKILLDNWEEIKAAIPDATLNIFYGWESYDALNANNAERMKWKSDMVEQMNRLDGVTDHGRIGHKQIIEEINKSDIFAYPCIFDEVYCISYVKAMAGGAYPVSSNYAELITYKDDGGVQVPYEGKDIKKFSKEFVKQIIHTLKNPPTEEERNKMKEIARSKYGWDKTAEGWNEEFNS